MYPLFPDETFAFDVPERKGRAVIQTIDARSILTKGTGFADQYDYTLNPYSGCAFGCVYCYAANFARSDELKATWGEWVNVKSNALELLVKARRRGTLRDKTVFMSSVTDPYQPVEKDIGLTRALMEELLAYHAPRLVIQTRSPLVTRDIDLLRQFEYAQVNMTVTTDDEAVRRQFEPSCPANPRRMDAIAEVAAAGIRTEITMTPLLPVKDPHAFAQQLLKTGVKRFAVQPFHLSNWRFAAGTAQAAQTLAADLGWTTERYQETFAILRNTLPDLDEGKAGFRPRW